METQRRDTSPAYDLSDSENVPLFNDLSKSNVGHVSRTTKWKTALQTVYFSLVACIGGLSFGLTVVFSSPLLDDLMKSNLTQWKEGFSTDECAYQVLIGPISPIAAVAGGLLSAPLTAVTGLVTGMILTAVVYVSGWTMLGCSYFVTSPYAFRGLLLTGRALTGFAMGFSAASVPVYIAEISPANRRGMLGGLFQMSVVTGGLLSYLLGGLISYWKAPFVFAGISVLHFVLLFTIQKSPNRSRNPVTNLRRLTQKVHEDPNLDAVNSPTALGNSWRLALVVMIMTFQQVSGVNAIVFYAGPILESTGWNSTVITADMAASLSIGVVQFLPTLISIFLVDRFGRRLLLFFGSLGLILANCGMVLYFAISYGFLPASSTSNATSCFQNGLVNSSLARRLEVLPLLSIAVFFVAFSLSWGPIAWTFAAEILPTKIRTLGNSVGVATNWIWVSVVTLLFPIVSQKAGYAIPFCIFAILALMSAIFVVFFMPETRGLTLHESAGLKYSVKSNVKEFAGLLKWCFCCQSCRHHPRESPTSSHAN
jgi:MFS family permease